MANNPEDKQSPANSPGGEPASPVTPEPEEDFPPELEWQLRAHPVVPRRPVAPPPAPPRKEAPAAAPAQPPAAQPPKPAPPAPTAPSPAVAQKPVAPPAAEKPPAPPIPTAPAAAAGAEVPKPPTPPAAKPAPPAPGGGAAAAGAPPKPPAAPKEGPVPLDNDLVKRFKARFGEAMREAWLDRKQAILVVARERLTEIAQYARDEEKFDFLTDLTAVDWPKREKRFDVVLNLYSFAKNERLRLKVQVGENESAPSVTSVWPVANWLEREAYDMFGVVFEGHPNLKRILLPEEWQGHPLRKDYDILTQDTAWIRENLGIESGQ